MQKMLIADDDREIVKVLEEAFSPRYSIIGAYDGKEAVEKSIRERPDIILMDANMPAIDGITATNMLRDDSRTRDIPVIIITGFWGDQGLAGAFGAGAVDYIEKPFSLQSLDARVQARIRERKIVTELKNKVNVEEAVISTYHKGLDDAKKEINKSDEELERLHHQLVNAYDEMKELERLRGDFLQNISHELRTPLSPILFYLELMKDGSFGNMSPDQALIVNEMFVCGKNMQMLIDDLVEAASIKTGRLKVDPEDTDIRLVLHTAVKKVGKYLASRNIKIMTNLPPAPLMASCDPRLVSEIFTCLIRNAIKFNRENGSVEIEASEKKGFIEVIVSDDGIGIPKAKLEKIFKAFYQGEASSTRRCEGLGLGLYLVNNLIKLHGGKITVESEEGVGTKFTVSIPRDRGYSQ